MVRVTNEDKIKFNELYIKYKTYAAVARETGFSPATVKKYIVPDYVPADQRVIQRADESLKPLLPTAEVFGSTDWGHICELTPEEEAGIKVLWGEMDI